MCGRSRSERGAQPNVLPVRAATSTGYRNPARPRLPAGARDAAEAATAGPGREGQDGAEVWDRAAMLPVAAPQTIALRRVKRTFEASRQGNEHRRAHTQDGTSISPHFGRSGGFFIFEVHDGKIAGRSVRTNTFTAHAKGECHGSHENSYPHGHDEIVEALRDCEAVLCYGMGWRAAEALKEGGILAYILPEQMSPEEAVEKYVSGGLLPGGGFCRCDE